ncbi:hypothetical protein Hamer_G029334 [Homarus americanus]|uniref:Uncharacterized protein n=1 Tax=Homarus americanus TaxID=6706 RepID=A0A8J5NBC8_HOMAM|nr:hypothetical protein Hamer_G029334 [Homarus americanus]
MSETQKVVDFHHPQHLQKLQLEYEEGRTLTEAQEVLEKVVQYSVKTQHQFLQPAVRTRNPVAFMASQIRVTMWFYGSQTRVHCGSYGLTDYETLWFYGLTDSCNTVVLMASDS